MNIMYARYNVCVFTCVFVCACIQLRAFVCTCVFVCVCVYTIACVCMYLRVCLCVCIALRVVAYVWIRELFTTTTTHIYSCCRCSIDCPTRSSTYRLLIDLKEVGLLMKRSYKTFEMLFCSYLCSFKSISFPSCRVSRSCHHGSLNHFVSMQTKLEAAAQEAAAVQIRVFVCICAYMCVHVSVYI